jgi:hypothetical protein
MILYSRNSGILISDITGMVFRMRDNIEDGEERGACIEVNAGGEWLHLMHCRCAEDAADVLDILRDAVKDGSAVVEICGYRVDVDGDCVYS